ncbi:Uncharacterised protein [Sphingobacterium daejeonense]|nr:Uncharacterised protein [Sphingobacterium daejeonense]
MDVLLFGNGQLNFSRKYLVFRFLTSPSAPLFLCFGMTVAERSRSARHSTNAKITILSIIVVLLYSVVIVTISCKLGYNPFYLNSHIPYLTIISHIPYLTIISHIHIPYLFKSKALEYYSSLKLSTGFTFAAFRA